MFNPSDLTPDMEFDVSLGDFHQIHDEAFKAQELIAKGTREMTVFDLRIALSKLKAGQHLSNAETGPDAMDAPNYRNQIQRVEAELKRRGEEA